MNIGLDVGYSRVKVAYGGENFFFPSIIGTSEEWFSVDGKKEVIEIDGEKFLVGDTAIAQSSLVERREDRGWIESDMYKRLVDYSLVRAQQGSVFENDGQGSVVVSGLPIAYFNKDASVLKRILLGEHTCSINGTESTAVVRSATIVPQPFGSLLNDARDNTGGVIKEKAVGRIGVIDIGGKTTNILSVTNLAENSREATSVNVGGWTIVRKLSEFLTEKYDIDDRTSEIEKILRSGSFTYYGDKVNISSIINDISQNAARQIEAEISQRWGSASQFDKILISGGGSNLIGDELKNILPQAFVVENPVMANALGFYKFSKRN